jgi:hypothetical protein
MKQRKAFKNRMDRMVSLLTKQAGLEYPTEEICQAALWHAKSRVKAV